MSEKHSIRLPGVLLDELKGKEGKLSFRKLSCFFSGVFFTNSRL